MVVVLVLLALSLIGTGGAAVVFGAPIIQIERGYTMVLAGTMGVCSGILLLGIALAAQRLGRTAQELVRIRDRLERLEGALSAPSLAPSPSQPSYSQAPPGGGAAEPPAQASVVGQYASGGNSYVMYSDGSVDADTPTGQHRFRSLDELRAFVAGGGERTGA